MKQKSAMICAVLVLSCAGLRPAFGQAATSSITGSVRDATGAVVPGASVVITNRPKGLELKLETTNAGVFNVIALTPSTDYAVTITKPGFSTYEAKDITLQVGQALALSVTLTVASTGTSVTVTAETPLVETTKTDVSSLVDSNQLLNLPINGRRVDAFVLLGAGVGPDAGFGLMTFRGYPGGNSFLTDGVDTTNMFYDENAGRTRTYNISQDAVQEFEIVSSNFLPEYGRAAGGVVNTITRSGSNDIHGSAYWFFRNRTLNATDPTSNGVNPPEWRHQAGLSVGGPIKRDKLFYFFNGELQRRNDPILSSNISSTLFDPKGNPTGAISPTTGCGGSTFATPASPAQCQTAIAFLESRVVPQLVPRTGDVNLLFGKIDYAVTDRNRVSMEMNYLDFRAPNGIQTAGALTNGGAIGNNANTNVFDRTVKVGLVSVVSPTSVNEARFGLFKDRQYDSASPSLFPVTGTASYSISSGSLSNIGVPTSYPRLHPSELRLQFADTFSYTVNKHAFKLGIDFSHTEDYDRQLSNQYGTWTFPDINAFALDFSGNTTGRKDYTTFSQKFGNPVFDGNFKELAFFAQDEYHVTPKLTLSGGFRVDHTTLPQPTQVNPDFPQTGVIKYKPTGVAPRFGAAYAWDSKTVFRLGYGMFNNRYVSQVIDGLFETNGLYQPSYTLSTAAQILSGGPVFPNPLAAAPNVTGTANVAFSTDNFRNSYSEQWEVAIQREVMRNTSLTVSYVGSRGLHLISGYNANLGAPTATFTYPVLDSANTATANQVSSFTTPFYQKTAAINPNYSTVMALTSDANSWYNAMLVQFTRRYSHGFEFQANYTWSHTIDDNIGGAAGSSGGSGGVLFVPSSPPSYTNDNLAGEKGSSATDQRHRLVINGIYSPTFTRGNSALERYVVNGWTLSLVSTFASAFPINSIIGGVSSTTLPTNSNGFLTSSINGLGGSFRVPFQPVNNLDIPDTFRTDARISKTFSIIERIKVQLAFEAVNVFNHLIPATGSALALQNQEYSLVKPTTGPFAGQSVLVPFANYKQLTSTSAQPDGTTARRAQASLRITF